MGWVQVGWAEVVCGVEWWGVVQCGDILRKTKHVRGRVVWPMRFDHDCLADPPT